MRVEPKITFSYSGQKTLDLGFGGGPAAGAPSPLSWDRMRKVDYQLLHQTPQTGWNASITVCSAAASCYLKCT